MKSIYITHDEHESDPDLTPLQEAIETWLKAKNYQSALDFCPIDHESESGFFGDTPPDEIAEEFIDENSEYVDQIEDVIDYLRDIGSLALDETK